MHLTHSDPKVFFHRSKGDLVEKFSGHQTEERPDVEMLEIGTWPEKSAFKADESGSSGSVD